MNKKAMYKCPFCSGSGVTPFLGSLGQKCTSCKETGLISEKMIVELGIESFVDGFKNTPKERA